MSISNWEINKDWTLFLDRDGVINERIFGGYVTSPEEFHFSEGTLEAIRAFSEIFNRIIVVTNQQGIAKGIMTERNLFDLHDYMVNSIEDKGGRIDAIYFASNLRGAENDIRKPKPDMGLLAKKDFKEIDFSKSIMVGDTDSDIQFGKNLGMKTVRVVSEEPKSVEADIEVGGLLALNKIINDEINS